MTTAELDIHDLVMEQFRHASEDCMLFPSIASIDGKRRDSYSRIHDVWSWRAERSVLTADDTGRRTKVSVSQHSGRSEVAMTTKAPATVIPKDWIMLERQIPCPDKFVELKEKHRMPTLITVGLAAPARVPPRNDTAGHKLFSSMPLPVSMPLPMHVNASFILADDRRNIRFDQSGMDNLETAFNRWLLSEAIPELYIDLLVLLPTGDPSDWWPRQRAWKHHLAGPFIQGFCKRLSKCQAQICVDVRGQRVAPQSAVFLPDDHSSLPKLYCTILRPSGLVFLSTPDQRFLASQAKVTYMNADHARAYLMTHSLDFTAAYNRKDVRSLDIQALVTFLEPSRLKDLPLLLLANDTLTSFSSSRKPTFVPKQSTEYPWPFLPADRFVHPHIDLKHCVQEPDLRIALLNNAAIGQLMRDRIPDGASRDLSPENAEWARSAWSTVEKLADPRESAVDMSSLPLIPTATNLIHVSLQACTAKDSQVLITSDSSSDRSVQPILEHFGARFLETQGLPPELMKRLETGKFNFETALRFLHSIGPTTLRSRFETLGPGNHKRLAEWIVDHIKKLKSRKDIKGLPGLIHLPIWKSYQGSVERYEITSNIHMLPLGVTPGAVEDFMPHLTICGYSKVLEDAGRPAMSFSQLRDKLVIPASLDDTLTHSYLRLLKIILQYRACDSRPPLVPNQSGILVLPSTLFKSNEDVFTAAFTTQPHRFIHHRYIEQESALHPYGFKSSVDISTFVVCAQAIHQDTSALPPDRLTRAVVLYQCFSNQLPHEFANAFRGPPAAWRQLDHLNFIPARRDRRRSTIWCHDYAEPLEDDALRSPATMLRSDLQGIAWTQRFLFAQDPAPLLLFADKQLGVPTVRNVVSDLIQMLTMFLFLTPKQADHLVVLSTRIALDHPRNETVLQDLRETYSWLAQTTHVAESGQLLGAFRDKAIWLNVDNPQEDAWIWNSADQIVFNGQDSEKNNQREAHSWMSNYKQLLLASGAREIHRPAAPVITLTPVEAQYRAARATVDTLRTGRKLTDVIFVAEDGQEFVAHRIWMATASDYFLDMFAGSSGFSESSDDISPANPVRIDVQFPSIAVRVCLGMEHKSISGVHLCSNSTQITCICDLSQVILKTTTWLPFFDWPIFGN
jgi:hypothetical protein